jgi:hypothetical protein
VFALSFHHVGCVTGVVARWILCVLDDVTNHRDIPRAASFLPCEIALRSVQTSETAACFWKPPLSANGLAVLMATEGALTTIEAPLARRWPSRLIARCEVETLRRLGSVQVLP